MERGVIASVSWLDALADGQHHRLNPVRRPGVGLLASNC
jgi:hypothetical protein